VLDKTFDHLTKGEENATKSDYDNLHGILDDFWDCFVENRVFLTNDIAGSVKTIYGYVKSFHDDAYCNLPEGNLNEESAESLRNSLAGFDEGFTHRFTTKEWEAYDLSLLVRWMGYPVDYLVKQLQDIYRSVAGLR
jgi:hypothetical protein